MRRARIFYACFRTEGPDPRDFGRTIATKGDPLVGTKHRLLNPETFHDVVLKKKTARKGRNDRGFSIIEIMAAMAIIAILALAIVPQFGKYFERAAVQNLMGEMTNAALLVTADHSLTGKTQYTLGTAATKGTVSYSVAQTKIHAESKLVPAVTNGNHGFTITGSNTSGAIENYTLVYYGGNNGAGQPSGLVVTPK